MGHEMNQGIGGRTIQVSLSHEWCTDFWTEYSLLIPLGCVLHNRGPYLLIVVRNSAQPTKIVALAGLIH